MNQSDSNLPSCIDNNLEHAIVLVNNDVESVTGKTIFMANILLLNMSCFEEHGFTVISRINFDNVALKDYCEKNIHNSFVLAFENNDIETIKSTIECFKSLGIANYKVALPRRGKTWFGLSSSGQLATDKIEKTLNEAYSQGQLFFATSPQDYFNRYREQYPNTKSLIFEFDQYLYKGYFKKSSSDTEPTVDQLTDCRILLIHSMTDESKGNKLEYYLKLYSEREGCNYITLTDAEFTRLSAFKTALQKHRQIFYGKNKDLTELISYLFEINPPKVRALSAIGYDTQNQGYFFPEFAYDRCGILLSNNNYYQCFSYEIYPNLVKIKPFMNCSDTVIKSGLSFNPTRNPELKKDTVIEFITPLYNHYGNKGLLAFGFYISSLFSHKVIEHYEFFPILSLYGNPSPYIDDKRFLSHLFNCCLFIDSTGQKMKADFTTAGELKKISQKSNLVCALLDDRKYKKLFDYDTVLPFYNRKALSSNATLAFLSSTERFNTDVIREFVISLQFPNTGNVQPNSFPESLNSYTPEELTNVGHYLLSNREWFENRLLNEIIKYETFLKNIDVTVPRMAQNYAIALGGIVCLLQLLNNLNFINELQNYTLQRVQHKQKTTWTPAYLAQYFLDLITKNNILAKGVTEGTDFHGNSELLIDLPVVLKQLKNMDFDFNEKILSAALKEHPLFLGYDTSFEFGTTRKVYSFEKNQNATKNHSTKT